MMHEVCLNCSMASEFVPSNVSRCRPRCISYAVQSHYVHCIRWYHSLQKRFSWASWHGFNIQRGRMALWYRPSWQLNGAYLIQISTHVYCDRRINAAISSRTTSRAKPLRVRGVLGNLEKSGGVLHTCAGKASLDAATAIFLLTGCHHNPMAITGSEGGLILGVSLPNLLLNRLLRVLPNWPPKYAVQGGFWWSDLLLWEGLDCFASDFVLLVRTAAFFWAEVDAPISDSAPRMLACGRKRSRNRKIRFPMFRPTEMSLLCTSLCTFRATVKTAFVRLQPINITVNYKPSHPLLIQYLYNLLQKRNDTWPVAPG